MPPDAETRIKALMDRALKDRRGPALEGDKARGTKRGRKSSK
ncbi:MAG: hypothetical protein ABIF71_08665 [Planctomycetota bacterium]